SALTPCAEAPRLGHERLAVPRQPDPDLAVAVRLAEASSKLGNCRPKMLVLRPPADVEHFRGTGNVPASSSQCQCDVDDRTAGLDIGGRLMPEDETDPALHLLDETIKVESRAGHCLSGQPLPPLLSGVHNTPP